MDDLIPVLTEVYQPEVKAKTKAEVETKVVQLQHEISPTQLAHIVQQVKNEIQQTHLLEMREALKKELMLAFQVDMETQIKSTKNSIAELLKGFSKQNDEIIKSSLPLIFNKNEAKLRESIKVSMVNFQEVAEQSMGDLKNEVTKLQTDFEKTGKKIQSDLEGNFKAKLSAEIQAQTKQAKQKFMVELNAELPIIQETFKKTIQQMLSSAFKL